MEKPPTNMQTYWKWKARLTRILHTMRVDATGLKNIPTIGGGLLTANHLNWKDVLFIATRSPRPLHYVATEQLFDVERCTDMFFEYLSPKLDPWLSPFTWKICYFLARHIVPGVQRIGTIPTTRGIHDRRMFAELKRALREGHLACIFSEGGTSIPGKIRQFKKGAAKVIYDLYTEGFHDIPIIPTLVTGTEKAYLPGRKLGLHFGRPLFIRNHLLNESKETISHFTKQLENSVRHLLSSTQPSESGGLHGA
jgi:1-acyl-sn-glycerol-3-phosphate acyltransferase